MDATSSTVNLFIQLSDKYSQLSILPITIHLNFESKSRAGAKYHYGATQEFKFKYIDSSIIVHPCQHIESTASDGSEENEQDDTTEEDDGDFEDDDNENDEEINNGS